MEASITGRLVAHALETLLDPGTSAENLTAAEVVLRKSQDRLLDTMETVPKAFIAMAPDRLARLRRLLSSTPATRPLPVLATALHGAFDAEFQRLRADSSDILAIRRAHEILALMPRLGIAARMSASDLAFVIGNEDCDVHELYPLLEEWCRAAAEIPACIVNLVEVLRECEDDSPRLDKLAAWVAPSAQGMTDLAGWENGLRCGEKDWDEASARWVAGVADTVDDAPILKALVDWSDNAALVQRAFDCHGTRALDALRRAYDDNAKYPILRVILSTWTAMIGGAR
ncbi:MAG: hypothetical protein ACHREM_11235 [Polyangiales bacterium]